MSTPRRSAFILPAVLVIIGLLALTMAGFMFFVRAELAGVQAERDAQQARLAAESGLQEVIAILRKEHDDPTAWFDRPDRFRHVLVWAETYERENDPCKQMNSRTEFLRSSSVSPAWRFSVVAPSLDGLPGTMRFGITPEGGKLNLNTASEAEITRLFEDVLPALGVENTPELIACLLDWLDTDDEMRPNGAETEYYKTLVPGYCAKNGPLDTLEELLLVKGFTAAVLYGEDTNRNGILDRNEDDGDASFPYYDNGDGLLNYGLAPFVTVWSRTVSATGTPGTGGTTGTGTDTGAGQDTGASEGQGQGKDASKKKSKQADPNQTKDTGTGASTGARTGGVTPPPAEGKGTEGSPATEESDPNQMTNPEDESQGEGTEQPGQTTGGTTKIDVNTASVRVLRALDGMTSEGAEQIVALRAQQSAEALGTTEWLVASGALDPETYAAVKDRLTTKSSQFHVEIVGYADHTRQVRRYEWIVELHGPVVQVLYHRDLTRLGFAWPVDDDTVVITR